MNTEDNIVDITQRQVIKVNCQPLENNRTTAGVTSVTPGKERLELDVTDITILIIVCIANGNIYLFSYDLSTFLHLIDYTSINNTITDCKKCKKYVICVIGKWPT